MTHHQLAGHGQAAQREAAAVEGVGLDLAIAGEQRGGEPRRHRRGHPQRRVGGKGEPEPAADGKLLDGVGARDAVVVEAKLGVGQGRGRRANGGGADVPLKKKTRVERRRSGTSGGVT